MKSIKEFKKSVRGVFKELREMERDRTWNVDPMNTQDVLLLVYSIRGVFEEPIVYNSKAFEVISVLKSDAELYESVKFTLDVVLPRFEKRCLTSENRDFFREFGIGFAKGLNQLACKKLS